MGGMMLHHRANYESATGFTLYMDTILRIVPHSPVNDAQTVPHDADWEKVKTLQEQGFFSRTSEIGALPKDIKDS